MTRYASPSDAIFAKHVASLLNNLGNRRYANAFQLDHFRILPDQTIECCTALTCRGYSPAVSWCDLFWCICPCGTMLIQESSGRVADAHKLLSVGCGAPRGFCEESHVIPGPACVTAEPAAAGQQHYYRPIVESCVVPVVANWVLPSAIDVMYWMPLPCASPYLMGCLHSIAVPQNQVHAFFSMLLNH